MERNYHRTIPAWGDVFTVEDWFEDLKDKSVSTWDGHGYWVKDGLVSEDEVYATEPLDATHVIWFNK